MIRFAPEVDRGDFQVGCGALGSPNFDRFRAGSAIWAASGVPIGSGEVGQELNLSLFGRPLCQSSMRLCEDVLKWKCRSEPNVNPACADRDHGANL